MDGTKRDRDALPAALSSNSSRQVRAVDDSVMTETGGIEGHFRVAKEDWRYKVVGDVSGRLARSDETQTQDPDARRRLCQAPRVTSALE